MTATPPWLRQQCDERVGAFTVAHDLALSSGWTVLFGPSGTGKSTWLRMLAGLVPQRTGSLLLHGAEIRHLPAHRRRVALVEQSPALFPHRNVEQNVGFSARLNQKSRETVDALLADFHLLPLRHADVRTLSGGERQRVAIARALCSSPRLLLLDEVFTGMDTPLQTELLAVLRRHTQRTGLPVISVTHNIAEAFATADEVLRMHSGQIVAQGAPSQVLREEREDLLQRLGAS